MKKYLLIMMIVFGFTSASMAGSMLMGYTEWAGVSPAVPTMADTVSIVVGGHSNNAIFIIDTPFTVENNVIDITLEIGGMVQPVITDWSKWIEIGTLAAGDYQVNIYENYEGAGCDPVFGCHGVVFTGDFTVVPEPTSIILLGIATAGVLRRRR